MVFHVDESKESETKERKEADINFIEGLCRTLETDCQTVKNVTRLGKRNEEADKPRPLKLVFEDNESKGNLWGV